MIKKCLLLITGLFGCMAAEAQNVDSLKTGLRMRLNEQFPSTRDFDIQYEQLGARDFTSKLYGQPYKKGRTTTERRIDVSANIDVYTHKNYTITASFRYNDDSFAAPESPSQYQYFAAIGSFTYFSRLFNKPLVYNASLITDGNEYGFQRVYGQASALLVLKHTRNTTISVGLLGNEDPSSLTPVIPIFSVQHTFQNSGWNMDFILPQRLLFRKMVFGNSRISIGSELAPGSFYIKPSFGGLTGTYQYTQAEIHSGASFDHKIGNDFILSFRAGYQNIVDGRLIPKNGSYSDDKYRYSPSGTSYFNVGFSYNPFKRKPGKMPN